MLRPELQSMSNFVDGLENIVENQTIIAKRFIAEGSADTAILPLKALIYIMAEGEYEGMTINDSSFRKLFDRSIVLESNWYKQRLERKVTQDQIYRKNHIKYLENRLERLSSRNEIKLLSSKKLQNLKKHHPKEY